MCKTKLDIGIIFLLMSQYSFAANYDVASDADLRTAINGINGSPGTTPLANANTINITASFSISGSDMLVLRNGATVNGGGFTIDGVNAYRVFATSQSDLTLQNLTIDHGLAEGGSGGGGGLGAGGGVYIDVNRNLVLNNVAITNSVAKGGAGSAILRRGGGGSSFTYITKNASGGQGGGAFPGGLSAGTAGGLGGTTVVPFASAGYGGGVGSSNGVNTGGSATVGDGAGTPGVNNGSGGAAGYCGGGGGGGGVNGNTSSGGGGGGGGNGGAAGGGSPGFLGFGGGGGAGFGSGGGAGTTNSAGGGGGFGGGGGNGDTNTGGGGGGFGGGAGRSQTTSVAAGGNYGGVSNSTGGGGGAGIGGAIFVADTARLTIQGTTNISGNSFAISTGGGGAPTNGSGLANDVFLFRGASLLLNGSSNISSFAIDGDSLATAAADKDAGITVNTTGGAVVTLGASSYQGNTLVSGGTLQAIGANLPGTVVASPGSLTVQTGATFTLTSGTYPINTIINNQNGGILNIGGTFAPPNNSINAGTMNINTGGSFTIPANFTYTGNIVINTATNPLANALVGDPGSTLTIANGITYTTNNTITDVDTIAVTANSTFNIDDATIGVDTAFTIANGSTATITANFAGTATSPASNNSGILNINNGGTFALAGFTNNVAGVINFNTGSINTTPISNNGVLTASGTVTSNTATITNNLTMTVNAGAAMGGTSPITNTATLNIDGTLNTSGAGNNSGIININNSGSFTKPATFTNTGTTNLNGNGNIVGAYTGNAGSVLRIGDTSAATYTTTGTITDIETIIVNLATSSFTVNNAVTGVDTAFTIANGATATIAANFAGTATSPASNSSGILNINNGGTFALAGFTNNAAGAINFNTGGINTTPITNNGAILVIGAFTNSATITNNSSFGISSTLGGAGTINNQANGTITFNTGGANANAITNSGAILVVGASSNSATITNNGSFGISSTFSGAGTINNQTNGILTFNTGAANSNFINNNLGTFNINGDSSNSNTITNSSLMNVNAELDMTGQALNSSGTVAISGFGSVITGTYTNSSTHTTTIADVNNFGFLTASGAVDLTGSTLNVLSTNTTAGSWEIMSSASNQLTGPSNINLPSSGSGLFSVWTADVSSASIIINLESNPFALFAEGEFNIEVAGVLDQMANNITNAGQAQLIDLFRRSPSVAAYNNSLHQMMPIANSLQLDFEMQNTVYNKVEARIASIDPNLAIPGVATGINVGDLTPSSFMWLSASGSLTNQGPVNTNDGYNAKTGVILLGADTVDYCRDQVVGMAGGYSYSYTNELSNAGFVTKTQRYHGLLFGTLSSESKNYVDWLMTGSFNTNTSHRTIAVAGYGLGTHADYNSYQFGARATTGRAYDFWDSYRFTPLTYVQYAYLNQKDYNETGSVAALHVDEITQNIVTLGLGAKFAFPLDAWRLIGMRELRASVSYDVLHPDNITTANFLVGSTTFDVFSTPERISYKLGAGMTFEFAEHILAEINYDFEYRSGFTDHTLLGKVKYVF